VANPDLAGTPGRVAICGGGVAALEALMALRDRTPLPHVDLIAPEREFVYQPLAVAEPFGLFRGRRLELAAIAREFEAELHVDALAGVDGAGRRLSLASGAELAFDAAIVAVGARRCRWLDGAVSFGGSDDVPAFAGLLARLESGVSSVVFTCPPRLPWTLPLYELALLTAGWLAERGAAGVELSVVTPEAEPLGIFGPTASAALRGQLSDRGIRLRSAATPQRLEAGRLRLADGETVQAEEVVALPQLAGPQIEGLPADAEGFIRIDDRCRVIGTSAVFAAGDGTAYQIRQGGIAAQQADLAADCVAALLGAGPEPPPFQPLLRGTLLTGLAPMFLQAAPATPNGGGSELPGASLWNPPAKIAARHLAPYLSARDLNRAGSSPENGESLPGPGADDHGEARELALTFARADAHSGDYRSALDWLLVVEQLDGLLPRGYPATRERWEALLGGREP
jgi:sulfide:quinone oxidoreductase